MEQPFVVIRVEGGLFMCGGGGGGGGGGWGAAGLNQTLISQRGKLLQQFTVCVDENDEQ